MRKLSLIVGATTRDHFQIIGRRDVVKDDKKKFYVDIRCEKCGEEIKNVKTTNLEAYCQRHDYSCQGSPYRKPPKREKTNAGNVVRGHYLITARNVAERKGRKFYYIDIKCTKCGTVIKNIRTTNLSTYCRRHEHVCTGSPYSIGAVIASKDKEASTSVGVGNTKIKTTKTGGVNLTKLRTVRIPGKFKPGCAKTEKGSNFYDTEIDKTIETVMHMERGGNVVKLRTIDNDEAFESECRLCYDRLAREGALCPVWAVNYETFREWYKKNVPKIPDKFLKYRIYLARRNNSRLLGPDNVVIGCFAILN